MGEHTKGPWHLRLSDNATPHIEHGDDCFLDEVGCLENRICVMPAEISRKYNSLANAHLIAAAPELLEALSEIINDGGKFVMTADTHRKARAAIAKAKGETK